jgi:hypothetical protein
MEELEQIVEQLEAILTPEQRELLGPGLEEVREGVAALHLARTVREDLREALELAMRLGAQAVEDYDRAAAHFNRARELLTGEE